MVRKRLKREATTLLTSDQFRSSVFRGEVPAVIPLLRKQFTSEIKQDDDEQGRKITFTITTEAKDRDGDIVRSEGMDIDQFETNPVVLFAHDARRPPIGRAVDISKGDKSISATAEFMDNDVDTSGFSDMIFRMVRGGFLNATSIGFIPTKFEFLEEDEDDDDDSPDVFWSFPGLDFIESELLEFSIVPVPANPEALIGARHAGIDIHPLESWLEEALDGWANYKECLLVPRTSAECWYKLARSAVRKEIVSSSSVETEATLALGKLLDAPEDLTTEAITSLNIDIEDSDITTTQDLDEVIVDEDEFDALDLDEDGGTTLEADDALEKDEDDALKEDLVESDGEYTLSLTVGDKTVEMKSTSGEWINTQILEFLGHQDKEVDEEIQEPHPEIVVQDERPDGAPPLSFNWKKDESGRYVTVVVRAVESDDDSPTEDDEGEISDEDMKVLPGIVKEVITEELDRIRGRVT